MWKESLATEAPPKNNLAGANTKPVTEEELQSILDRLESTREVFRQNRELRDVFPAATPRLRHCGPAMRSWKRSCGNLPRCF